MASWIEPVVRQTWQEDGITWYVVFNPSIDVTGGVDEERLVPVADVGDEGKVLKVESGIPVWGTDETGGGGGGTGDVVGPASAVDGHAVTFDGVTGKLVKDAGAAPVLEGDSRLTNARTPSGAAGGALSGSYPNPGLNDETVQDIVGGMVSGNTETGISITYDDPNNKLNAAVAYGTTAGTAAEGNDSRLSDARTPTSHASSHGSGGGDPITIAESQVTNLTSDLAGKVPTTRTVSAGTGLSGGGDLSADRTLSVSYGTASGTAAEGNDSRLSDSRTPTAHKTSHATGGGDALAPSDIGAVPTSRSVSAGTGLSGGGDLSTDRTLTVSYGTAAGTAAEGNDSRLSDARTPTAHKTSHATGGGDALAPSDIGAVPTTRTVSAGTGLTGGGDLSTDRTLAVAYGTSAGTAAQGNDARLSDARTPKFPRVTFSNADYTIVATTSTIVTQTGTLSAARVVTLPAASTMPAGSEIIVQAGAGCSATNTLSIARAGSDTINGSASSIVIATAYGWRRLTSDGVSAWTLDAGILRSSSNLSDVADAPTALTNLGATAKATLTTKGDIYVATGAGAITRVGVGTDGYVLTADAAQTAGVKWAAASGGGGSSVGTLGSGGSFRLSGGSVRDFRLLGVTLPTSASAVAGNSANRATYEPYFITDSTTIDRVALEVTTGATAGAIARLGIYTMDNYGQPAALVKDFGTVPVDAIGMQTITISPSFTISPGRYYGVVVHSAQPSYRVIICTTPMNGLALNPAGATTSVFRNFASNSGSTSAFPDPAGATFTIERDLFTTAPAMTQYILRFREAV